MTANTQAASAGSQADEIIKQLSNPQAPIETDKTTVEVLDKAQQLTQPAPVATPDEDWKKRFTGYKASTDSTIHNLRQKANQFDLTSAENVKLKKDLEDLKKNVPTTPDEMLKFFSKEEVDGFSNYVDSRVGSLQGEVKRLQEEAEAARKERQLAAAQQEHMSVVDAVRASVPNYAAIDNHPEFKKWIGEPDSFGNVRYDLLIKAKQEVPPDIGRIVSFYNEFASTQNIQQDAKVAPPAKPTIQELMQTPKSAPSGSVPQGAPQSLGIKWDTATSSQFYKDKTTGKYTPEQALALEQDLFRSIKKR